MSFHPKIAGFFILLFIISGIYGQKIVVTTKAAGLFVPQTTFSLIETKSAIVAASGLGGLSCIDPLTGKEIGAYADKRSFLRVYSGGGTIVYALTDAPAILVFDVKKPSKPTLIKTVKLPRLCTNMSLCGKNLALYSPDTSSVLLDVTNPTSPKITTTDNGAYRQILAFKDQFLCIKENNLYSFSPANAEKKSAMFLANLPLGAAELFIYGEKLFILMLQSRPAQITVLDAKVEIKDSTFPADTRAVFSCALSEYVLTKSGSLLKLTSGNWVDTNQKAPFLDMNVLATNNACWFYHQGTDLFRISFSNSQKPVISSMTPREKIWSSIAAGSSILISGSAGKICFYDTKNPAKVVKILEKECNEAPLSMFFRNNFLTVFCTRSVRVYLFDGSKNIDLVSAFLLDSPPLHVIRTENDFYMACGANGLLHFLQSESGTLALRGIFGEKKADVRAVATDGKSIIALDSGYGALYYEKNASGNLVYKKRIAVPGGIISAASADDGKIYLNRQFAPPAILQDSELYDAFFPSQTPLIFSAKYILFSENGIQKISRRANQFLSGSDLPDYQIAALTEDTLYLYSPAGLSVVTLK